MRQPPFQVKYKHWVDFVMPITIFWKKSTGLEPKVINHELYFFDEGSWENYEVKVLKEQI